MEIEKKILQQISEKGGFYSLAAKMYMDDETSAKALILEFSEQCHHESLIQFWGEDLVEEILKYSALHKGK